MKIFTKLGVSGIKQKLSFLLRYISSATLSGSVTIQAQAEHYRVKGEIARVRIIFKNLQLKKESRNWFDRSTHPGQLQKALHIISLWYTRGLCGGF